MPTNRRMESAAGREKALAHAYRALAIRPRSEREIRQSLKRKGFEEGVAEEVVCRLKDQALLDDRSFAVNWTQNRVRFHPRSKRLIQRELSQKGVSQEEIAEATEDIDDDQTALSLARRRITRLENLDRKTRTRRLATYLQGRGFSRSTVTRTLASLFGDEESET